MSIQVLPPHVIDQIAAGEVVDRPANLIKELVENSIDAGAQNISIEFSAGGKQVAVHDDGKGIPRDELSLALHRHATSKIAQAEDLWSLSTFGFRGEALASISAVSQFRIVSRIEGQKAFELRCEFGKCSDVVESSREVGTSIYVNDLFSNIPARLKFMKTDAGEGVHIKNHLKALALANPNVSFRIVQNGELIFVWNATDSLSRAVQVLDAITLYPGEAKVDSFQAKVFVASPDDTGKTSRQMWIFVQGRFVQDRTIQAAIQDAYRGLLMHGEYPIAAVFLSCDPAEVDVNVSPTKSQVKFRDSSNAFRVVSRAVRDVLERAPWRADMLPEKPIQQKQIKEEVNQNFLGSDFNRTQYRTKPTIRNYAENIQGNSLTAETFRMNDVREALLSIEQTKNGNVDSAIGELTRTHQQNNSWANLHVLAQAHLTYIVCENDEGILFVDQHAAHERVIYEKLFSGFRNGQLDVQNYLLPLTLELEADGTEYILKAAPELKKLGIEIEQMGPASIAISSAPAIVKEKALLDSLEKSAEEIRQHGGSFQVEKMISDVIATLACHSAVRAGQALSHDEMVHLLKQMDEFPLSSFCPHGRPVFVEYELAKLERDFGRTV